MVERRNTGIKIWQHRSISGSLCECPILPMYLSMHFTLGWSPIISVTFFDVFLFGVFSFCYLTVMLMDFMRFSFYVIIQFCQWLFCTFPFIDDSNYVKKILPDSVFDVVAFCICTCAPIGESKSRDFTSLKWRLGGKREN